MYMDTMQVEEIDVLSTLENCKKWVKCSYTLSYPHYPHFFCVSNWFT